MNDETQNDNKTDNNSPDQQINVTDSQRVDQSTPPIENGNKKIPLFSRKNFGKKLIKIGLILAVLMFVVSFFMPLIFYGSYGDYATHPEIKLQSSLEMVVIIIFCLSLIVVAFGFIVNFKSYKYTMNKNKLRYLYLISSMVLSVFALLGIYLSSMSIVYNVTEPIPKPKNESAVLKALQSASNNDIVSINNFKTEDSQYKDGYVYSGTYYLKGLNAGIDFDYYDLVGSSGLGSSNFIFDGTAIDYSQASPYEKNPYFKNYALYKTYFKNDSGWKSFENFYNQTGETKLGMISRTTGFSDNVNDKINLRTVKIDGHPFNEVLAVSSNMDCRDDNATCKVYIIYFDKSLNSWKLITDNYKSSFNLLSN